MGDFNIRLEKAWEDLFLKADKGEKKVGNPKYRLVMNDKGHKTYILANPEEVTGALPKMSEEEFETHLKAGFAERHYDKVPTIRTLQDLNHATFIREGGYNSIIRSLKRVEYYKKSIRFAQASGKKETAEGQQKLLENEYKNIDTQTLHNFNNQDGEGFGFITHSDLKALKTQNDDYVFSFNNTLNGFVETADDFDAGISDYMNNNYANFDVVKLVTGVIKAVKLQKEQLIKQGVPTEGWKPRINLNLTSSGFKISMYNDSNTFKDKYGWDNDLSVNLSRTFGGVNGNKSVSHDIFTLGATTTPVNGTNPLRKGFAKAIMQNFYEQYKNTGLNEIKVLACNLGQPDGGCNTWGRWGFRAMKSSVEGLLSQYRGQFNSPQECWVDEQVVYHDNPNEIFMSEKNNDGTYSKVVVNSGERKNAAGRLEKITLKTKQIEEPETGLKKYKTKILRHITVTPEDVNLLQTIFTKKMADKSPSDMFRLKDWYDNVNNDVVKGIMARHNWWGKVDLNNPEQAEDFESNLFKKYKVETATGNKQSL